MDVLIDRIALQHWGAGHPKTLSNLTMCWNSRTSIPRNLQTGPTERIPNPEYLIALPTYIGSAGKDLFNSWWKHKNDRPQSMSRPFLSLRKMPPNFEAFVWRAAPGCLALNLHIGSVLSSSPLAKYWWVGIKVYPISESPLNEFIPSESLVKYPAISPRDGCFGRKRSSHQLLWVSPLRSGLKYSNWRCAKMRCVWDLRCIWCEVHGVYPEATAGINKRLRSRIVVGNAAEKARQTGPSCLFVWQMLVDKPILLGKIWNFEPCPNVTFPVHLNSITRQLKWDPGESRVMHWEVPVPWKFSMMEMSHAFHDGIHVFYCKKTSQMEMDRF